MLKDGRPQKVNVNQYFFEDKPLFGMDIGHDTIRVVQFDMTRAVPLLKGYGATTYDTNSIANGVVVKPELIAKTILELFRKKLTGQIDTKRVAIALPGNRALTRAVRIPKLSPKDISEAVHTQVEQYIPGSIDNLYIDYDILREDDEGMEVFIAAMPKTIVDSYLTLTRLLGLEAVLFDTSISASARLFAREKRSDIPSVLVDFGALSTEITIFSNGVLVTGTAGFAGDGMTREIASNLHVTAREAFMLKSHYGLSKSAVQKQITRVAEPSMELLMKEIRRSIRYYEQHYGSDQPIGQVVTMGGGANMPGLADYLTDQLRLPARTFDPTTGIAFGSLRPFPQAERLSYVTAAGLAVTDPGKVFL